MTKLYTAYAISNLAELQQMIEDVIANVNAAAGRKVDPSEIAVLSEHMNEIHVVNASAALTDGSEVYNLEF